MSQTSPPRTPRASAGPLTEKRTNLPLNVSPLRKAGKHSMLGDDGGSPRAAAIPKGAPTQGDDDLKGELRSLEYTKEDRAAGPSSGLPPRFRKRAAKTKENSADTPQTAPRSRVHDDQTSLKTTDGERPAPANEGEGEVPSSVPAVRVGTDAPADKPDNVFSSKLPVKVRRKAQVVHPAANLMAKYNVADIKEEERRKALELPSKDLPGWHPLTGIPMKFWRITDTVPHPGWIPEVKVDRETDEIDKRVIKPAVRRSARTRPTRRSKN